MSKKYTCNLCQYVLEPASEPVKPTDMCPGCRLRTRHRAYGAFCALNGDPTRAGKTLICHASPEELSLLFASAADKFNFDIRPCPFLDGVMDIQNMAEIPDRSRDVFVALHVLQQVRDDARALAEIARVLKPGGLAVFTAPFRRRANTEPYPVLSEPHGLEALQKYGVGTYRRYGLEDLRALLERWFALSVFTFVDPLCGELSTIFAGRPAVR